MAGVARCALLLVVSSHCALAFRRVRTKARISADECSPLYGQCGGRTWHGATCCVLGAECVESNEWYSQCQPSSSVPRPTPSPPSPILIPTTSAPPIQVPSTSLMPMPVDSSNCTCAKSTIWDGDFAQFADGKTFCQQNFGGNNPYISGGGGDGNNGGWSGLGPCTSGQYSFCDIHGWQIGVTKAQGEGKAPYRAFAYAQFCNGKPYSECWGSKETVSFSFSFETMGIEDIGAYIKLLFWTDSGNIIGLLPPKHPKGSGRLRLVTFMQDDYPNKWSNEVVIRDMTRYHVRVDFAPASSGVSVFLDGGLVSSGTIPVNMLAAQNGPQIGVYGFDFSQKAWPQDGFALRINHPCIGEASPACISGGQ